MASIGLRRELLNYSWPAEMTPQNGHASKSCRDQYVRRFLRESLKLDDGYVTASETPYSDCKAIVAHSVVRPFWQY